MYLEIDEGFHTHRKTIKLVRLTGTQSACGFLIKLWSWACRSCRDGDLTGLEPEILNGIMGGDVYNHVVAAGFIDEAEPGRPSAIHNWLKYAGTDAMDRKKEKTRERVRRLRERRKLLPGDVRPGDRFDVFARDGFRCRYCGKGSQETALHVDHVIPRAAGGTSDMENLVTSCAACNLGKSAKLLTTESP